MKYLKILLICWMLGTAIMLLIAGVLTYFAVGL